MTVRLMQISTGLDTAATYDITLALRSSIKAFGNTGLVSLLQPPPEVFKLFDEVRGRGKGTSD
jgi:hypothetical protein